MLSPFTQRLVARGSLRGMKPGSLASVREILLDQMRAEDAQLLARERYPYARTAEELERLMQPCECATCLVYGGDCPTSLRLETMGPVYRRWMRRIAHSEGR